MNNDLISRSALLDDIDSAVIYSGRSHDAHQQAKGGNVVIGRILVAPAVDAVPVDDMLGEMLNWAVRYALGRMTYAVSDTVNYVMPLIPKLDRQTLVVMKEDIKSAPLYGHGIDKTDWIRLVSAIQEELKRRADHETD